MINAKMMDNAHKESDLIEKMDKLYVIYVKKHGNPLEQNDIESKLAALQFRYHNLTGQSYNVRSNYVIQ